MDIEFKTKKKNQKSKHNLSQIDQMGFFFCHGKMNRFCVWIFIVVSNAWGLWCSGIISGPSFNMQSLFVRLSSDWSWICRLSWEHWAWCEWEYTLDENPVHYKARCTHTFTPRGQFRVTNLPSGMLLEVGGNRRTKRKHRRTRELGIKPGTLKLWGSNITHTFHVCLVTKV